MVARNQMQLIVIYALFVGEQRFSGCTQFEKIVRFGGKVAVAVFLENGCHAKTTIRIKFSQNSLLKIQSRV